MTNVTKWLIALPFVGLMVLMLPAAIVGDWQWFAGDWAATTFVALTAAMWLAATAFVDVNRPRGPRDAANVLIPLGLILVVPVAVADRVYGPAANLPGSVSVVGLALAGAAIPLGMSARVALGRAYQPRATVSTATGLVQTGPYRWVRHPLYAAALLWFVGWPLIIASLLGAAVALFFLLPALPRRMQREEADLRRAYGHSYDDYCRRTWRLVPYLY
jgi:protein-S-isoprenylcysteine O-methyltransferase Ste14